jgi:hypothetical protein
MGIGEDHPGKEQDFRDLWEDEKRRETVLDSLNANCAR